MDKLGLTRLEKNLLIKILNRLYEANFSDITLDDVSDDEKRDRGALGSLIKKGIVEIEEYEDAQYKASLRPSRWAVRTLSMIHLCEVHWAGFKPEWI